MEPTEMNELTNIDPNKVSEALAQLTLDMTSLGQAMNVVKKVRKTMKAHAEYYEREHGIDAGVIRDRYDEMQMDPRERERKYVLEEVTRRALSLWTAEDPEDFEELMRQATEVDAASGDSAEKLTRARARSDGFNSGLNGGKVLTDNPHRPGSLEHQEWAIGCADALGEEPRVAAPKRGRPRKPAAPAPAPETDDTDALFADDMAKVPE